MSSSPAPKSKTVLAVEVLSTRIYKLYVPTSVAGVQRIAQAVDTLTGMAGGHTFTGTSGVWIDPNGQTVSEPVACYEFVVTREQEAFHAAIVSALHALVDAGESCALCTLCGGGYVHCITVS